MEFKPADWVICIKPTGILVMNGVYQIVRRKFNGNYILELGPGYEDSGFDPMRFRLTTPPVDDYDSIIAAQEAYKALVNR